MHCTAAAFLLLAALSAPVLAQDPPAPPGGFAITQDLDRLTTWSDGYRTRTDLRYPSGVAPATGWPGVLLLHGHTGSRKVAVVRERALLLARAGYVTIAYDTRGEGDTVALNPGAPEPTPARNVLDVAEAFHLAELQLGPRLDAARLGQYGQSGGASKTLQAASWCGLTLPEIGFVSTMPQLACILTDIQCVDFLEDRLPAQATLFTTSFADENWQRGGAQNTVIQALQAGNQAGVRAVLAADPVRNFTPRLLTRNVPILLENSWGDVNHFANASSDLLTAWPAGVARRFLGSTGVHGTADNDRELQWRYDLTRRWCDCFLKGIANGVDQEPAELAIPPLDPNHYLDPARPWAHRLATPWPATTPATRAWLRAGGQLALTPPVVPEGPFRVRHQVAAGYDLLGFMTDGMAPAVVRTRIPESEITFDLPAANIDRELVGRAVVEFDFVCPVANAQLSASLFALPPAGQRQWITSGAAAVRGVTPGVQHLRIVLEEIPAILPAGYRLQLAVHNTFLRRQPGNLHYFVVPEFQAADFDLQASAMAPAFVDLPLQPVTLSLVPRFQEVSAGPGLQVPLALRAGQSHAGDAYFLLFGASGTTPPLFLPAPLHLVPDAWTQLGLTLLGTPALSGYFGTFDAQGQALARLQLPPALAAALVGVRLDHVALGVDAGLTLFTSAPATVLVVP